MNVERQCVLTCDHIVTGRVARPVRLSPTLASGHTQRGARGAAWMWTVNEEPNRPAGRFDDLDRRLAAAEQLTGITTRRAEAAEASLTEQQAVRAQLQRDLDAINGDLTQANADRAALRVQLQDAQAQATTSRAQAAASQAQAGNLAATADALRSCLEVHKQALYYTTLDNWGMLAIAMQGVAANCAAELG